MMRVRHARPWLQLQILLCCVTVTGSAGSGASFQSRSRPNAQLHNVVLITIDTLRADYVGCYGSTQVKTPSLDSLASDGVLFERAYCQVPLTPPSHASILTGLYPESHGLRDFTSGGIRPGTVTLAAILRERDYQTAAFVSALVLDEVWGLAEGFELYYDDFDLQAISATNPGNVQRKAEETIDQVLPWLRKAKSPFFLWVHLFDPHHDYDPPPSFRKQYASNLYAGEVAYADSQIARLLSALRTSGRYDDALIIATSDHGESLGEHGEQEHGFFLYEATLRIPLIVKLPKSFQIEARKVSTLAETVDILPTVLQVLRIPSDPQWHIEGQGLLSAILGKNRQDRFIYAETIYPRTTFGWSPLRAFRMGDYKLIDAPHPELYHLSDDPHELRNQYASNQSLALQLRSRLRTLERAFVSDSSLPEVKGDNEKVERLSALGYVALGRPVPIREGRNLEDPKDNIAIYNRILMGLQASESGNLSESNRILGTITEQRPELFIVHYSLGLNYLKAGHAEKALAAFETARKLNPAFTSIDVNRARALSMKGEIEQAITILTKLTQDHPNQIAALRLLATLYLRKRQFPPAIRIYRAILLKRPEDRQALKSLGMALVENRRFDEGLKVLNQAIQSGIDDALIRNSQGIALSNLGRLDEAIQSYRKALSIRPVYAQPRLNLALALLRSGKKAEAIEEFNKLCRQDPKLCKQYRSFFLN